MCSERIHLLKLLMSVVMVLLLSEILIGKPFLYMARCQIGASSGLWRHSQSQMWVKLLDKRRASPCAGS